MPKSTINFDTVRNIGLTLPGVEESTAYGSPALKVHGKLLACVPAHRSAEPGSLVVRVGFGDRAELLAAAPDNLRGGLVGNEQSSRASANKNNLLQERAQASGNFFQKVNVGAGHVGAIAT